MFDDYLINVLSVALGYENLIENRQQSEANNIAKHNQQQAEYLLKELGEQFKKQNEMLEEILKILKGDKK